MPADRPNILLVVSDEERRNDWLDGFVDLPAHQRLQADGITFDRYYTHSSPCSPSRASLFTGSYLAQHGVVDNVSFPAHVALDPAVPTIGSILREAGYESTYFGKWHLSHSKTPEMMAHGYAGWEGIDSHYTGTAWTGRHFDPIIADQAIAWLRANAGAATEPWCMTVALVNPHDIMWFPIDQPSYQAANPEGARIFEFMRDLILGDLHPEPVDENYPRRFTELPANFDDDLHTKPEVQRAWRQVRNTEHMVGSMDLADTDSWLRQLDYYAYLHEPLDQNLGRILDTLDEVGAYDDTLVLYTSDHGDACGSHGLRAKLPCVYEEVMGVPLMAKLPGRRHAGEHTQALATHVDLAATMVAQGGVDPASLPTLKGRDLSPTFDDPSMSVRDHVLFSQDSAQSELIRHSRYAVRGFFDGTTKYARYYGIGGGIDRTGQPAEHPKLFDTDADFDDHDHEWYDLTEDPHELTNLAHDRSRRGELRELHARLLEYEAAEFA
ncbi:MAG: sulfatase-like hydrolase/transferase [Acidimicrobiia bacterium]|nr:sulfatase-like hydrolase/transferase [Acidimicrobiia bacterium]